MQNKHHRMNAVKHTNADWLNNTGKFNSTLCNKAQWNDTLPSICANLTLNSLNSSIRSDNGTSGGRQAQESRESVILRFFLIALIFVLIVIGNSLTIHVVRHNRNLTSIKNYYYGYYIMNLSISDLLVGLVCLPTTVLYYILPGRWRFGLFLCKLFPTLQIMVVSASISTLTVITFERFLAIVHPLKPRSTSKSVRYKIIAVWIWSFIIALPSFIAYKIDDNQYCQEIGIEHWYTIALFLANYAVPLTFIFVTYLRIIFELKTQNSTGSKREIANHKKFLKLTVILVASFALCFLPSNVIFFILGYSNIQIDGLTISTLLQYFHVLIWFNSCLNPFIYGSVDRYFKKGFKKALGLASSNDSQDKTNLSRMSTFKGEKNTHGEYKWLPPNVPEEKQHLEKGHIEDTRSVRFAETHQFDKQNNNRSNDNRVPDVELPRLVTENLSNRDRCGKSDETGFVSLVLYQSKLEPNMSLNETNIDENKELFVDLNSSNSLHNGQSRNAVVFDLSDKDELKKKVQSSRETVI